MTVWKKRLVYVFRAEELCESQGGRPGLPVSNSPYGLCGRKATSGEEKEDTQEDEGEAERKTVKL